MKFIVILLLINVWSNECNSLWQEKPENINLTILTEIISNYLYKYFDDANMFLSIISSSLNLDQCHFHEDLSSNLLVHPKLYNFSYTILSGIDQSQRGNKIGFNLMLIDQSASLM